MQSLKKSNSLVSFISDLLIKMIQQNVYVSQGKGAFGIQQTGHQTKKRETKRIFFMRMKGHPSTTGKV